MKINIKNIVLLSVSSIFLTVSCTKDFEDVNKNPLLPGDKEKGLDGLASGGLFPGFINKIIPTPTGGGTGPQNTYQVTINMTGDNWIGYFSPGVYGWDGGSSLPNFHATPARLNGIFSSMIGFSNDFMNIKGATHDLEISSNKEFIYKKREIIDQGVFSIAQIIKIMGYHRATDMFGPLPYSKVQPGEIKVPYDSQEDIYKSFLKELEEAVATLNQYKVVAGNKIITDYDPLYQGDVSKWIKLGNSLMLRLGIRIRYADPALASEYINKAFNNEGGLISNNEDTAKLKTNGKFRYFNSLYTLWKTYDEVKMGATIYSFLKGYNDPRLPKYFSFAEGGDEYKAIRLGVRSEGKPSYKKFSNPNLPEDTPTYWMKASEVQFLLAEAALANIISGNAKDFYKKGVALSFEENGISSAEANSYISTSGTPVDYEDISKVSNNMKAVSSINKEWSDSATEEENLERIITQKYIAIYPDGLEAWSEWRRTGYPRIFKEVINLTNLSAQSISSNGKEGGVRRLPFPESEYRLNTKNVNKAVTFLSGSDNAATNVWWDKKSKN